VRSAAVPAAPFVLNLNLAQAILSFWAIHAASQKVRRSASVTRRGTAQAAPCGRAGIVHLLVGVVRLAAWVAFVGRRHVLAISEASVA
jgi:hypothetical protein